MNNSETNADAILQDLNLQQSYIIEDASVQPEIELSESRDIIEVPRSGSGAYTEYAQPAPPPSSSAQPMWTMQPPQPYIPNHDEPEIPVNIGRAKIRSPNGGSTHFNVFLNQTPQQQPQSQQQQQTPQQFWQQQTYNSPAPQAPVPQMYVQQASSSQPMYTSPGYNCYQQPYGMGPPMGPQQPTVVYMMNQTPNTKTDKPAKTDKPTETEDTKDVKIHIDPVPVTPPTPPKPTTDELTPVGIASIIIASIAFIMGILCLVKTEEAFNAYMSYEEEGNGNESSVLFEQWQMLRNVALGSGAACVSIYSLAFLLIFWAGMQHKMRRKVVSGCCMTIFLIGAWIVFAFSFVIDVVILVLAFDNDNVVYPEIVWAAFIGHGISWLLMLVNEEMARRWIAE